MNKKQAARARRRAAKPEPNMPTVDELVEIGMNTVDSKNAATAALEAYIASEKEKALQAAMTHPIMDLLKRDKPHLKINSTAYKIPFEYQEIEPKPRKLASNNRPKPKDPTYDHKPRKIVLE